MHFLFWEPLGDPRNSRIFSPRTPNPLILSFCYLIVRQPQVSFSGTPRRHFFVSLLAGFLPKLFSGTQHPHTHTHPQSLTHPHTDPHTETLTYTDTDTQTQRYTYRHTQTHTLAPTHTHTLHKPHTHIHTTNQIMFPLLELFVYDLCILCAFFVPGVPGSSRELPGAPGSSQKLRNQFAQKPKKHVFYMVFIYL